MRDLKTYMPDNSVLAMRQKNAIKETVGNLKVKLEAAKESPTTQDFFSMNLLVQDLTKIQSDISSAIQSGTQWTSTNFDCTKEELDEWIVSAHSIYYDLEHAKKGKESQQAAISEAYKKNVVVARYPKINSRKDWTEIMLRRKNAII